VTLNHAWRTMTDAEKAREVARISDVSGWPESRQILGRLQMKKLGPKGYTAFGFITSLAFDGPVVPEVTVLSAFDRTGAWALDGLAVERFATVAEMVEAGWIVD
jgi:hypothetical protein